MDAGKRCADTEKACLMVLKQQALLILRHSSLVNLDRLEYVFFSRIVVSSGYLPVLTDLVPGIEQGIECTRIEPEAVVYAYVQLAVGKVGIIQVGNFQFTPR